MSRVYTKDVAELKGVMKTELGRYQEGLDLAMSALHDLACLGNGDCYGNSTGNTMARECIEKVRSIVHPPPEMEEVTVVKWLCPLCDRVWPGETVMVSCCKSPPIKLTGAYTRPKAQPVEKSTRIRINEVAGTARVQRLNSTDLCELLGKTGTFTWQEQGDKL